MLVTNKRFEPVHNLQLNSLFSPADRMLQLPLAEDKVRYNISRLWRSVLTGPSPSERKAAGRKIAAFLVFEWVSGMSGALKTIEERIF